MQRKKPVKSKVPIASKSRSVALVLWPARVPSSCFMGQLVPSPRCHGCSEPSSISLGHAHIQLSDNKLLSRAHALHATCPTEGVSTIQTSSSQKCGPISKTKIIFLVTLSYYLPFSRYGPFAGVGSKHWWVKFLTPLQERRLRPVPVSGHCVRCCCGLAGHKTSAGSFENVLHEAVKIIEFIKF